MVELAENIEAPFAACQCGWTSYEPRFPLKYHALTHRCGMAEKEVRKQERNAPKDPSFI